MANGDGQRPQGITPSVIIGLGGTGKHVIMRLRKLMASHYGRIKDFPVVAYLVVDTDPTEELDPSLVIEDFRLTPSELIEAVIPNATTIFRGLEEGHQKHIRSWFNYEKLKSHTDLKKGADSVRQLGRLCFYWNYPQVRQRLEDARMQIEAEANQDFVKSKWPGLTIEDNAFNIYIITSLAGGTGAGMLLDVAYLAHEVFRSGIHAGTSVVGSLLLPQAFRETTDATRKMANGYAALKELNYFMYNGRKGNVSHIFHEGREFEAQYGEDPQAHIRFVEERPFNYCYLMDTNNGKALLSRDGVFELMARNVYLEFTSKFAQWKAGQRVNLRARAEDADAKGCTTAFFAAGLSFFYYPASEAQDGVTYRLAREVAQEWLGAAVQVQVGTASTEQVSAYVDQFLARQQLAENPRQNMRFLTGQVARSQSGQPFPQLSQNWKAQVLRQRQEENWDAGEAAPRLSKLFTAFDRRLDQSSPNPDQHGEFARAIAKNGEGLEGLFYHQVEGEVAAQVEDPQRGIAYARAFLAALRERMAEVMRLLEEEYRNPERMARLLGDVELVTRAPDFRGGLEAGLAQEVAEALREVEKASKALLRAGRLTEKKADESLDWAERLYRAKLERIVRTQVIQRLHNLDAHFEGLDARIGSMTVFLDQLRGKLEAYERERKTQTKITVINGELLYESGGNGRSGTEERYYALLVPNPVDIIQAIRTSVLADPRLAGLGGRFRIIDLPAVAQSAPEIIDTILRVIHEKCQEHVRRQLQAVERPSAATELASAYGSDDALRAKISDVFEKAAPFVMLERPSEGGWTKGEEDILIGMTGGDTPDAHTATSRIAGILESLGVRRECIRSLPDEDSHQIIFSREQAAYPLRALSGISDLKRAYDSVTTNQAQAPLHINDRYSLLPDIEPVDEVKAGQCKRLWYLGNALDVIESGVTQSGRTYYVAKRPNGDEEFLGNTKADVLGTFYRDARIHGLVDGLITARQTGGPDGGPSREDVDRVTAFIRPYRDAEQEQLRAAAGSAEHQDAKRQLDEIREACREWLPADFL